MHVTVLLPDIHQLQTGGNIYNRRMIDELREELSLRTHTWDPEATPRLHLDLPDPAVLVVDSLLTRHPPALQALRSTHPTATLVLLSHYLHCIDPEAQNTERAESERSVLELFDGVVTTSRFAKRALVRAGVPRPQIRVVPPGLDALFHGRPPLRSARPHPRLLTVANLLPEKGVRAFLDVLHSLQGQPWTWTLVGDASLNPSYARDVLRRLHTSGLADRVTYTGPVSPSTLRTWYDRSDVFVLPSLFETRSMAMREAMARGLPVVGHRVGGLPENLGDAPAGHLVPPGDATALAAALRSLLTDPMSRRYKGRAAHRQSQTFPTWQEAATRFRSALADLTAPTPTGPSGHEDR